VALPSDSTALAQALSDLDLAVRALNAQRHRLELKLASLLPVYRLPHETLASIFSHCVPTTEDVEGGTATPVAFAFSQVSRFWRCVALDTQALWTAPLFPWPRLAREMIRRAGDAPLVIACTVPVFASPARKAALDTALSAALARFEQIRRLTLRGEVDFVEGTLDSLRGPAPLLEFLCGDADSVPENDRVRNALIFPSLFGGDAPRLKELRFGNAALHWDAGVFRTLTELSISCTKLDAGIEYENILSTLEHTPLLVTLSLDTVSDHDTLFEDLSGTFAPRRPLIPLPHLRKLALNDDALHTIALVQQLELSSEVDFDIRNSALRLGAVGVTGWVLQEVARLQTFTTGPPVCALSVWNSGMRACIVAQNDTGTRKLLIVDFVGHRDAPFFPEFVQSVVNTLPLRNLAILDLACAPRTPDTPLSTGDVPAKAQWIALFRTAPRLRGLGTVRSLTQMLYDDAHDPPLALPELDEIVLRGAHITSIPDEGMPLGLFGHLGAMLKLRAEAGHLLRRLAFQECTFANETLVSEMNLWAPTFVGHIDR
jgi:hypothetical protein